MITAQHIGCTLLNMNCIAVIALNLIELNGIIRHFNCLNKFGHRTLIIIVVLHNQASVVMIILVVNIAYEKLKFFLVCFVCSLCYGYGSI